MTRYIITCFVANSDCCNCLNLDIHVVGQSSGLNASPGWLRVWEHCDAVRNRVTERKHRRTFLVDLIHGDEVVHVLEVDIDLDHLLPGGPGGLQHAAEVSNALRLGCKIPRHTSVLSIPLIETYGVLLDAAFDNLPISAVWGLTTQKDQSRDFGGMRYVLYRQIRPRRKTHPTYTRCGGGSVSLTN